MRTPTACSPPRPPLPTPDPIIEVSDVTMRYGHTVAVGHLSFEARPGEVTAMRMVVGLDAPTSCRVSVDGYAYRDLRVPPRHVGALLEAMAIHPRRSARDHLRWPADSNGIGRRRIEEVLELVGLAEVAHRRSGGFSLGPPRCPWRPSPRRRWLVGLSTPGRGWRGCRPGEVDGETGEERACHSQVSDEIGGTGR